MRWVKDAGSDPSVTAAGEGQPGRGLRAPPWPVVAAATAGLVVNLDTALNIALPAVSDAFDLQVAGITWIVVCYVLTYACLLVTTGRLADAFGHARMVRWGLALTTVGLAGVGLAPVWGLVLVGRVVQGAGAALILGAAPALVTTSVPAERAARALGQFQLGVAVGFAAGPPLGGMLTEWLGWRWVFLFRVPLAAGLALLLWWRLPRPALPMAKPATPAEPGTPADAAIPAAPSTRANPTKSRRAPLDLAGTLSLGAAVAAGLLALNRGNQAGWTSPTVLLAAALVVPLALTWLRVEHRAENPALDPALFRSARFSVANGLTAAANGSMFMVWLLSPYYLVTTLGHSTIAGGFLLAANPAAMALVAPLAGRAAIRWGAGRVASTGLAIEACGLAVTSQLSDRAPAAAVAGALALVGLGVGLFTVPNMTLVMGSIARDRQGVAGGLSQMTRTVGVVSGVALGSLALTHLRSGEGRRLGVDAVDQLTFLPAYSTVFLGAAALAGGAFLVSLTRLRDR
ncbi:MAG: MFS transporter [Acidimicrobiales bacterium]